MELLKEIVLVKKEGADGGGERAESAYGVCVCACVLGRGWKRREEGDTCERLKQGAGSWDSGSTFTVSNPSSSSP